MMKLDSSFPDHVVGVIASGEVDARDYEAVLLPALDRALKKHQRIRVFYQLGPEFTGFTAGAIWDDAKLGLEHWKAWERLAVVTDLPSMEHAIRMFAVLMPAEVKVFRSAAGPDARKWIAE